MAKEDDAKSYIPKIEIPAYLKISKIIVYFMYAWVMIGIFVMTLRVFLLAFSANLSAPFANFIYNTSNDYLQPFRGIFPPKPIGDTGYLDVAALFAIIVYLFVAWLFSALISYIQSKVDNTVEEQKQGFKAQLAQKFRTQSKTKSK